MQLTTNTYINYIEESRSWRLRKAVPRSYMLINWVAAAKDLSYLDTYSTLRMTLIRHERRIIGIVYIELAFGFD